MKTTRELCNCDGRFFGLELSWKSTLENWIYHDLPDEHPMKMMFEHPDEPKPAPKYKLVDCGGHYEMRL